MQPISLSLPQFANQILNCYFENMFLYKTSYEECLTSYQTFFNVVMKNPTLTRLELAIGKKERNQVPKNRESTKRYDFIKRTSLVNQKDIKIIRLILRCTKSISSILSLPPNCSHRCYHSNIPCLAPSYSSSKSTTK